MTDCWAGSKHELSINDRWVWETTQSRMQVYREMSRGTFNTDIIECMCVPICIILFLPGWLAHLSVHYIILGHSHGSKVRVQLRCHPIWSIKSYSVPKQGLFLYGNIYSYIFIMYREGRMEKREESCQFLMHELKWHKLQITMVGNHKEFNDFSSDPDST